MACAMMHGMAFNSEATFEAVSETFGDEANLWTWLYEQRSGHQSYEAIAYLLTAKGCTVSASTVRRWIMREAAKI